MQFSTHDRTENRFGAQSERKQKKKMKNKMKKKQDDFFPLNVDFLISWCLII